MIFQNQQSLNLNSHQSQQQLQKAYNSLEHKYLQTLAQFNLFKQSSIISYQKLLDQLEKSRSHNESFLKKLQKKYENILHEERLNANKNVQKLNSEFEKQKANIKEIISGKNSTIEKFYELLKQSDEQKSQIIEENTKNLISIVKSEENCIQTKKYSHTELMKMYQFLLEQNNCLKKQLMMIHGNKEEEKSNLKSKFQKNQTQIVYTEQSIEKAESMYVPSTQNQSQLGRKQRQKFKENSESINFDLSSVGLANSSKPALTYKPKTIQNKNKYKNSSSINNISQQIEQKTLNKKEIKRSTVTAQYAKKPK